MLPPSQRSLPSPAAENYALLSDIQIAGIKERLKLSAAQESYWPPVETALRAVARKIHAGRQANPNAAGVPIDPEAAEVQQLKSAAMPLLFQLREDQTGSAGDTVCKARLSNNSAVCSTGHLCTVCDPVAGLTFLVDPLSGVDGGATGSGTSGGGTPNAACAFKTITRALQAIGSNPAVGTVIQVRNSGPVSVVGNGERFPST